MGFSHDVVKSSLFKLAPDFQTTFDTWNPAFKELIERKPSKHLGQRYIEFTLVPEGPGRFNKIINGDERIRGGRRQTAVRGRAFCTTLIYAWDLPAQDLRDLASKEDVVGLIKKYPRTALSEMAQLLSRQLVTGDVADIDSFPTFNGDQNFDPRGVESSAGFFEFAAAGSQSSTVLGVAKNSIVGWHNQYGHISSFDGDGRKVMRTVYNDASDQMADSEGPVDLILMDPFTYENYQDNMEQFIRINDKDTSDGDPSNKDLRRGINFLGAKVYRERNIDLTAFTTPNAQDGVMYGLHTASWEIIHQGVDSAMETDGNFALRGGERLQDQEAWRYEYVLSRGLYTDNLRCNFAITGGAVE